MPFGSNVRADGSVDFQLWAPAAADVLVVIAGRPPFKLERSDDGWHRGTMRDLSPGTRYMFRLPDGTDVPDPASRYQPLGVGGASELMAPGTFLWSEDGWTGRPWHEAVIYELHIGSFTPEGTFVAAIDKLAHLARLGITAVQIMPVAEFGGDANWGYDGALIYAPESAYGRPDDLKALVDAAHRLGLMVFLDVVYNHFGPEGNYLHIYAPDYFTDRYRNPWGTAVNLAGPGSRPVREFIIHNALYWLEEFRFDGLRLDAVHALIDESPEHLLVELARRVRSSAGDRHVHLIVENEENDPDLLERGREAETLYSAQWNDDLHHVLHAAVTGEGSGYYADYAGDTVKLARAVSEGFAFQGEHMEHRGAPRGKPSGHLPPSAFIGFLQNHDQIGNRPLGDRITASAPLERIRAAAALYLLMPQIPMIFMGEEWAEDHPFPFFSSFKGELANAIRAGRRQELANLPGFEALSDGRDAPDPIAEETALSAKLDWQAVDSEPHAGQLAWYARVLAVRQAEIVPRIPFIPRGGEARVLGDGAILVSWTVQDQGRLNVLANLSPETIEARLPGRLLWAEGPTGDDVSGPWSVRWTFEKAG
jgi:malto-oligosyltrehalose trehalohydrolase